MQSDEFADSTTPAAILVFQREDGGELTDEDQQEVDRIAEELGPQLGKETFVQQVVTTDPEGQPNVSEDGTVAVGVIGLAEGSTGFDTQAIDDGRDLRDDLEPLVEGTGLTVQATGSVPQSVDQEDSSAQTLAIVGIATIVLIVVLLALIFRSVIICLMPILVVFLVSSIATGFIAWANDIFDLQADSSIQVILLVVLYGIGTDYILFLLFRYRERLRQGADVRASVVHATGARRRGDRLGRWRGDRGVPGADPELAEHLPRDRPGARHRGGRHPARRPHPGARRDHPAGPEALLAVEEVDAGARGAHVRARRRLPGPAARSSSPRPPA